VSILELGIYIEILDGSEWNGMIGTVDEIVNGIPVLFCIQKPTERYWLYPELMDKVRIIN
jgi:hypothetical protein